MGIFSRIGDVLKANINDMIDRAEDPEKMVKQIILDLQKEVSKATQALGKAMASERIAKRQYEDAVKTSSDWEMKAKAALNAGDIDQFLVLTRESGASSAMYLQNVVAKLGSEQPSMYALALAEHVLDGRGAVRIHGGGFGGTIQAFVPLELVDTFITKMNSWLGEGSARHYAITDKGAYAAWL